MGFKGLILLVIPDLTRLGEASGAAWVGNLEKINTGFPLLWE